MFPSSLPTPPPTIPSTRKPSPIVNFAHNIHHSYSLSTPVTPLFSSFTNPFDDSRDSPSSPRSGGDKRRRTRNPLNSSSHPGGSGSSPKGDSSAANRGGRPPPLKPVGFAAGRESRRQSDGYDGTIPSPVIMGFDYKKIDAEQLKTVSTVHHHQASNSQFKVSNPRPQGQILMNMNSQPQTQPPIQTQSQSQFQFQPQTQPQPQPQSSVHYQRQSHPSTAHSSRHQTPAAGQYSHAHPQRHSMQYHFPGLARIQAEPRQVRETISIREQQQALIAQRRREAMESNPPDPANKELTFKAWQHPSQKDRSGPGHGHGSGSRDGGGLLTVNTAHTDKDIMMASRVRHFWSYPLRPIKRLTGRLLVCTPGPFSGCSAIWP